LISYFCIILPGGFLFAENYKRLGLSRRKRLFQALSLSWFVLFLLSIAYLPERFYWISELIHLAFPVGMLLLQNPHYQRWRDKTDFEIPAAPIQKPLVLSVLFALVLFAGIAAKDWYLQNRLENRMEEAQQAYMDGNFAESTRILKALEQDYP